jgi:hypothetical protein
MPAFDIFLACAPKDYRKLPYTVRSIVDHVEGFSDIVVCSPTDIPSAVMERLPVKIDTLLDIHALPGERAAQRRWSFRPNWCFQQHLKLFQRFTKRWYATIDCDTIFVRPFRFFDGDKPLYWMGHDQCYQPYFEFQHRMIGVGKVYPKSFVADMNLVYAPVVAEMLERNQYTVQSFIAKGQDITTKDCCIGEPELYGSYVHVYWPDLYEKRALKQKDPLGSRTQQGEEEVWKEGEIEHGIEIAQAMDCDTISFHSWLNEGDQHVS